MTHFEIPDDDDIEDGKNEDNIVIAENYQRIYVKKFYLTGKVEIELNAVLAVL